MIEHRLKTAILWLGLPGALVGAWAAITMIASSVVWASDYKADKRLQTEINLQILIDLNTDKMRRAKNPAIKDDYQKRIERYEKQLNKLLEEKVK